MRMVTIESVLLRKRFKVWRILFFSSTTLSLALLATFRSFGFDYSEAGGLKYFYPFAANGWGLWYWFAQAGLGFYAYFFVINAIFASQLLGLSVPKSESRVSVFGSIFLAAYMMLWFLFGQARYGMAVALLASAASTGGPIALLILGTIAFLVHKAAIGGALLIAIWLFLRSKKYGLAVAATGCVAGSLLINEASKRILEGLGYANYVAWDKLPSANTPYKYYYLLSVLVLWRFFDKERASQWQSLMILTLIFMPFSYFIVFAGRSFEMFAVIFFAALVTISMPLIVRILVSIPCIVGLFVLFFKSGFYLNAPH